MPAHRFFGLTLVNNLGFEGTWPSLTLETHTSDDCDQRALSWLLIVLHGFAHPLTGLTTCELQGALYLDRNEMWFLPLLLLLDDFFERFT